MLWLYPLSSYSQFLWAVPCSSEGLGLCKGLRNESPPPPEKGGYLAELIALVPHLFSNTPALGPQEVPQVDGMDGRTGLLIQGGLLADPVIDLPVQGSTVIQEGLEKSN